MCSSRCVWLLCLFFAVAAGEDFGRLPTGGPICKDGVWTEEDKAEVASGSKLPLVQCWRKPPCIQSHYMTFERCAAMVDESDFPTVDPHLNTTPGMRNLADAARGVLANKTILFVGDSITGQVFDAARCDLLRRGLHLEEMRSGADVASLPPPLQKRIRAFWKTHARYTRLKLWFPDAPLPPWLVKETGTLIGFKGWHKYKHVDAAGFLALADAVVVNYALHYGNATEYGADMAQLFKQLAVHSAAPGKAAVFREANAQHFVGTGSYAGAEQSHLPMGKLCVCEAMKPAVAADNAVMRQNKIVTVLAAAYPAVKLLPFYDLTEPRFDMHEEGFCDFEQRRDRKDRAAGGGCCDCTHLCYTPQLWGHAFKRLVDILEESHLAMQHALPGGGNETHPADDHEGA